MRYSHNVERVLSVPSQSVALLAAMMLRGPQTVGELRTSTERLHRFADASAVEGFLHELGRRFRWAARRRIATGAGRARDAMGPSAGGRSRAPASVTETAPPGDSLTASELAALKANVDRLSADVAALKATVARLCVELGITT